MPQVQIFINRTIEDMAERLTVNTMELVLEMIIVIQVYDHHSPRAAG